MKPFKTLLVLSLAALAVVGCGKKENVTDSTSTNSASLGGGGGGGGGGNSNYNNYTFTGSVSGSTGYWDSPVINTDNRLVIDFTPTSYTGYGSYMNHCAQLNIQIQGVGSGQTTSYLRVGAGSVFCENGASHAVIDLSSSLVQGHGPIRVRISQVFNDRVAYACLMNGGSYNYCRGFDLAALYSTHTLNFSIQASVNGN